MPPLAPPPPPPLGRLFRLLLLFIIEDGQANCQLPIASTKSRRTHGELCFQLNLFLISILFLCVSSSVASTFSVVFFSLSSFFLFKYFWFLLLLLSIGSLLCISSRWLWLGGWIWISLGDVTMHNRYKEEMETGNGYDVDNMLALMKELSPDLLRLSRSQHSTPYPSNNK